jgi:DNA-binding ferritin-like protein
MKTLKQYLTEETNYVSLEPVLSDTFNLYISTQHYHWNVEGENFGEYHNFFGDIYEFAYGNLDKVAEQIRVQGKKVKLSQTEITDASNSKEMMYNTIELLNRVTLSAETASMSADTGLRNYLEDYVDQLSKLRWMAESYTK